MRPNSRYAWEPGERYRQGWHRDTLHSAEHRAWLGPTFDRLIEAIERGRWDHNNVQGHLALSDDHGFRAVPGSHRRCMDEGGAESFHLSPLYFIFEYERRAI